MNGTNIPSKFPIPFANAAGAGYIRTIPEASQISVTAGAASLTDGFVPLNFLPVAAGGVPPSGADFNGILNPITAAIRWASAGMGYPFDADFAAAIDGYPLGALIPKADYSGFWLNTVAANSSNPDEGGEGWAQPYASLNGSPSNRFSAADAVAATDVVNLETLLASFGSYRDLAYSTAPITLSEFEGVFYYTKITAATTWTLPAASSLALRSSCRVANFGSAALTVACANGNAFDGPAAVPGATSILVPPGTFVDITVTTSTAFTLTGGTSLAQYNEFPVGAAVSSYAAAQLQQVQAMRGQYQGYLGYTGASAVSLGVSALGNWVSLYGSTAQTLTLPPIGTAGLTTNSIIDFENTGTANWVISVSDGSVMSVATQALTAVTIRPGDTARFVVGAYWTLSSGSTLLQFSPIIIATATQPAHALQRQQVGRMTFTASGSVVVPPGITQIVVDACAAGGGGGGGASGTSGVGSGGGGGGAGQSAVHRLLNVTPGETITVTVPAATNGGTANTAGGNGGNLTIVGSVSGTLLTLTGGTGGGGGVNLVGYAGGAAGGAGYPKGTDGSDSGSSYAGGDGGTGASGPFGGGGGGGRGGQSSGLVGSVAGGYGTGGGAGGGYYISGAGTGAIGFGGSQGFAYIQW
ncbi:hypothetical protein [Robbsia sp. KACC 23696]|uniref:glycine-rich domain-containing protein n=1 Tax=Robbsia sp. KACC 23696 TaxID=3149231 RepID=UPI00325BB9CB